MAEITIRQPQVAVKFGAGKFQVTDFRAVTESRGSSVLGGLHHEYRLEEVVREEQAKTQNDEVFAEHSLRRGGSSHRVQAAR